MILLTFLPTLPHDRHLGHCTYTHTTNHSLVLSRKNPGQLRMSKALCKNHYDTNFKSWDLELSKKPSLQRCVTGSHVLCARTKTEKGRPGLGVGALNNHHQSYLKHYDWGWLIFVAVWVNISGIKQKNPPTNYCWGHFQVGFLILQQFSLLAGATNHPECPGDSKFPFKTKGWFLIRNSQSY